MGQVIRISLPGYIATNDNDATHYSVFSDSDNVLIKENARGSGTLSTGGSVNINHNLGYIPMFIIYGEVSSGRYRMVSNYNILGAWWRGYTTTNTLTIENQQSGGTNYRYYIFYDNFN